MMRRHSKGAWGSLGFFFAGLLSFVILSDQVLAQTPAQPVDPHQARPAVPVTPLPVAPETNGPPATAPVATASLSVVADSSLRKVIQELAQTWADDQDVSPQVPLTLTNAGTMRTKIEAGDAFDVIISADLDDMKEFGTRGILAAEGQRSVARNTVVLYGRAALVKDDQLEWFDLIGSEWKKIARPNPNETSSGKVANRALGQHKLLDDEHKALFTNTGTEILALQIAEREQADAVFVYKTDLQGVTLPGFEVFPMSTEDSPPVFYTAAVARTAKDPVLARSFVDFCGSEAAREIWRKYGFEAD